jgi:hypothetical protein
MPSFQGCNSAALASLLRHYGCEGRAGDYPPPPVVGILARQAVKVGHCLWGPTP